MTIKQRLEADMIEAMKRRESARVTCIRMLKSKLLEKEVALRARHGTGYEITDAEASAVIATYAKQRRDSIESYRQGGREDLVAEEQAELEIVGQYLPEPLTDDELRRIVAEAVEASGARTIRDLGAVMKLVAPRTQGLAEGKRVNALVRELLSGAEAE